MVTSSNHDVKVRNNEHPGRAILTSLLLVRAQSMDGTNIVALENHVNMHESTATTIY